MGIDWNGHPKLPRKRVKLRFRVWWILRNNKRLVITATSDGQHAVGSYHYQQRAVDFGMRDGGSYDYKHKAYQKIRRKFGSRWTELFGPGKWYVKNRVYQSGQFPGHTDHIHIAV